MTIEQRPLDAHSHEALIRLADALDTSPEELLLHLPPTWYDPPQEQSVQPLDYAECMRLLATEEIGRVAYLTPDGPGILPVTYALAQGRPLFRTSAASPLARVTDGRVAFEVDHLDHLRHEGWSVVVTGAARAVAGPAVEHSGSGPVVQPWAGGRRELYVVIETEQVTGRRITAASA